jgi:hypothetical protein
MVLELDLLPERFLAANEDTEHGPRSGRRERVGVESTRSRVELRAKKLEQTLRPLRVHAGATELPSAVRIAAGRERGRVAVAATKIRTHCRGRYAGRRGWSGSETAGERGA